MARKVVLLALLLAVAILSIHVNGDEKPKKLKRSRRHYMDEQVVEPVSAEEIVQIEQEQAALPEEEPE
jgi:hypothetical protein